MAEKSNEVMLPADPGAASTGAPLAGRGREFFWLWMAGFCGSLALYVATLAPDLVWQDAGDYQYSVGVRSFMRPGDVVRVHPWFLGLAMVLWNPSLWNYAFAANLTSAVGTAMAVANILLLLRLMTGRLLPAILGAGSVAVAHNVWFFAVVAQTYGWVMMFLAAECLCAWAWLAQHRVRWLLLLFLFGGMATSNHLLAGIGLVVFALWVFLECLRRRAPWWVLPAAAACWTAGATLYWVTVLLEYSRTNDWVATLSSSTVGPWGQAVFNYSSLPVLLGKALMYLALSYPTPLLLVGFVGLVELVRRRDTFGRLVLAMAALYFVWAARYKIVDQSGYLLPFYVFLSIMIGVGAARILDHRRRWVAWLMLAAAVLPVLVYAVLPTVAERAGVKLFVRQLPYRDPYKYFLQPWKNNDFGARRFAEETLDSLPRGAILLSDSTAMPPLECVHAIENRRPDVLLAPPKNAPSAIAENYWNNDKDILSELTQGGRRVFVVSNHPNYCPRWVTEHTRLEPYGLVWEVKPKAEEGAR